MKWLDEIIDKRVKEKISGYEIGYIEVLHAIKDLSNRVDEFSRDVSNVNKYVDIREQLIRESMFNVEKTINLKIREMQVDFKEDLELSSGGLMNFFDKRLNAMGEKKGIVTDLLKKIARLESV